MSTEFIHITGENGVTIYSNLPLSCKQCMRACNSESQVINCVSNNQKRRSGRYVHVDKTSVYLCTDSFDVIKSARLFKEKIKLIVEVSQIIAKATNEAKERAHQETKRLVHNIVSINAHSIQDLYLLLPQEVLMGNLIQQIPVVKEIISDKTDAAAKTLLRVAKHNAAQKTELAIFENLSGPIPQLDKKRHPIHKVVKAAMHHFSQDFIDNSINVIIQPEEKLIELDYTSVSSALYNLFHNATKYVLPGTNFHVSFDEYEEGHALLFDMISLKIGKDETNNLFEENYRGAHAIKLGKAGDGIGMSQVRRLLELNGATIQVRNNVARAGACMRGGIAYEPNQFIILFPYSSQT